MGGSGTNEAETAKGKPQLILGLALGLCLGVALGVAGMAWRSRTLPAPIRIQPPAMSLPALTPTPGPIHVYVNGAVAAPAVYDLPAGSLVRDAVEAAGGFTAGANTAVVNLAQHLSDGVQLYVPSKDEVSTVPGQVVSQPIPAAPVGQTAVEGQRVNINTATLSQLDELPGIGPSTAQKILDHRAANGPFMNIEAIMDVKGIGEAKFEQLRELIVVEGE